MMDYPDVLGFTLSEARSILESAGVSIGSIRITQPPRSRIEIPEDSFRVLKCVKKNDGSIELTVAKPL